MSARERLERVCGPQTPPELVAELNAYRAEILAEAKVETVAWLVKKARETTMWDAGVLASKVDRGAVRAFLGTDHYRDAMDAHRAEVLLEAAAFVGNDDDCDCGGCDSCMPRKLADGLRSMAGEKASVPAPTATPELAERQARLLDAIRTHGGEWTTRRVLSLYALTDPGVVQRGTARRDLETLTRAGHLVLIDDPDKRHYALSTRKDRV